MKFVLLGVFLSICGVVPLPIQSMKPHHDTKDVLHLFKTNPMELVSMMQNVNPAQLQQVISLLEGMLTDSKNLEYKLQTKVNATSQDLAHAVIEADEAKTRVDVLNQELVAAKLTHSKSLEVVDLKEDALGLAEQELKDQQPSLLQEQKVLREVIEMLENLSGSSDGNCSSHSECDNSTFCHDGQCEDCIKCHFNELAIDGRCPLKCPSLCEPAVYPKCPLCTDQRHCEAIAQSQEAIPHCEDGSGKCPPSATCNFEYRHHQHQWRLASENPQYKKDPAGGEDIFVAPGGSVKLCQCYSDQIHCILDQGCQDQEIKEGLKSNNQSQADMTLWCEGQLNCSPDQCSWITRAHQLHGSNFLNKLTHSFPQLKF